MSFGCRSGFALPRRCTSVYFLLGFIFIFTLSVFLAGNPDLSREERMEQHVAEMQVRMEFLEAMYRMRQEEFLDLQMKIQQAARSHGALRHAALDSFSPKNPDVLALLKSMNGSRAVMGVAPRHEIQKTPFVFQLLPHLMNDPFSLRPAYHLRSFKTSVNIVIGIPTVKRDKESYLLTTLTHLIKGMSAAEAKSTILVVFIGETDLEYVITTAKQIESTFPKQIEGGLIEVLSPAHSYYPNFEAIEPTLGDSKKRTKWRTKQNLDTIYLMSYAYSRGNFYLMLEDDVIASKNFIQEIRQFTAKVTVSTPDWFFIEFCTQGGIGKLFKSSNLLHFITYVQLFYKNMPVDWLLESYLGDRVCTINKSSKQCEKSKTEIRPKYANKSLFTHIGLFSSLKGKIQKVVKNEKNELVKHSLYRNRPAFYPHKNPPLSRLYSDILLISEEHSLSRAYDGLDYFWGLKPLKGNVLEFWFAHPTVLESYTFRSANDAHKNDKFYNTVVEVMPKSASNFTVIGEFDEFGLADDSVDKKLGPLQAIRLRVLKDSTYWVLLSEIELKVAPGSS